MNSQLGSFFIGFHLTEASHGGQANPKEDVLFKHRQFLTKKYS